MGPQASANAPRDLAKKSTRHLVVRFVQLLLSLSRTYQGELPRRHRLREDTGIEQAEKIPLGTGFRLKVPEDPTPRVSLEGLHLSFNVASCIVFELLVPSLDEVDVRTRSHVGAPWICSVVAGPDTVAIQSGSAIRHGSSPLSDDYPMVEA